MKEITFVHDSFVVFQNPYISLITLGWEKCKPSHSYSGVHDKYIIHFVKSGKGTLILDDKLYHLKENDVFLIRPNQVSKYVADEKDPWHYAYFSFMGVLAPVFIEETFFKNNNSIFSMQDDKVFRIIDDGLSNIRESKSVRIASLEYLFNLLSSLVVEPVLVKDDQNSLVKQIEQYMKQNYMKDIHVSEIAGAFNISRNYLFRIFKKYYGVSLKRYILNIRLEEAKRMLLSTDLPIVQISEMLGFKTYSTFFKLFKTNFNCTPKEYRQLIKLTNSNFGVNKSSNGIYRMESELDSIIHKEKYDTKI